MKPSFCASIFAFIIIGSLTYMEKSFNTEIWWIKALIIGSIIFPAVFYFYLNLAAEQTWTIKQEVKYKQKLTWILTVLQYTCFFLLWAAASRQWHYYAALLVVIHFTYIAWDIMHREQLRENKDKEHKDKVFLLRSSDITGLILSLVLLAVAYNTPKSPTLEEAGLVAFITGSLMVANIIFFIMAVRTFAYNPFRMLSANGNEISSDNLMTLEGQKP